MDIDSKISSQSGIALIMVLWVMVLLAAMATEFSYSMRVEINSTRNFKEEMESGFLAESGIELAIAEILEDADFHALNGEGQLVFGSTKKKEEGSGESEEGVAMEVPKRADIPLGAGTISYRIVDENRKISINTAPKDILEKILEEGGVGDNKLRDSISDAVLDWIDENDLHHLNGAEKDYYEKLPDPYSCKNGGIDTLEEMLWIKGVTPEIIFGSGFGKATDLWDAEDRELGEEASGEKKMTGIRSLITVENTDSMNMNTAPAKVLKIFLHTPEEAENILSKRLEKGRFDDSKSTHFTIYSLGEIKESGIKHLIVATVKLIQKEKGSAISITYWNDSEDPAKYYDLLDQST